MRFNAEAYGKLFPKTKPVERVESAVETFKPTEDIQEQIEKEDIPPAQPPTETEEQTDGAERDSKFDNE